MTVEFPTLRSEQELWRFVCGYAPQRPGIVHLTSTTKHIRAPSSGQGPRAHLTQAGSAGDPRASYFSLSDLCFALNTELTQFPLQQRMSGELTDSFSMKHPSTSNQHNSSKFNHTKHWTGLKVQQRQVFPRQKRYLQILSHLHLLYIFCTGKGVRFRQIINEIRIALPMRTGSITSVLASPILSCLGFCLFSLYKNSNYVTVPQPLPVTFETTTSCYQLRRDL